ncbi:hypothetical protein ScPMuIL_010684 [Solemya velum]
MVTKIANKNILCSSQIHRYLKDAVESASATVEADKTELYFLAVTANGRDLLFLDKAEMELKNYDSVEEGTSVASLAVRERHTLLVHAPFDDPRFPKGAGVKSNGDVTSVICVPIIPASDDIVAVVEFIKTHSTFTTQDLQAANVILYWMAACFNEINLMKIIHTQQRLNDFLLSTTKVMFDEITSIDVLVQSIMSATKNLISADRCALFLVDKERNQLFADYFDEGYDSLGATIFNRKSQIRFDREKGIAGFVAQSGQTVNIKDAYNDPRFNREIDKATGYKTRNILCMPIISKSEIVGVVQMVNCMAGDHFTNADVSSFKMLSVYCALAIHYARLYSLLHTQQAQYKVAVDVLKYHLPEIQEEAHKLMLQPVLPQNKIPPTFESYDFEPGDYCEILPNLFFHIIRDIMDIETVNMTKLCRFVLTVRKNYRPVIYHNWYHGFAVAHSVWCMVRNCSGVFTRQEKIALVIAGICHDLDHRGYNNAFFQKLNLPLASLYSTSVMEQHHYRQTVTILQSEGHDIFSDFDPIEYKEILDMIRENIMATDLALYFINQKSISQELKDGKFDITNLDMRRQLRSLMMTGADLCSICKPWDIQVKTANLIYQEFYSQGDEERKHGVDPLPMMDRLKMEEIPKQQLGFIDFICSPLFRTLSEIVPGTKALMEGCFSNRVKWQEMTDQSKK